LKPEWWGSPLVQECQEEKACGGGGDGGGGGDDDNDIAWTVLSLVTCSFPLTVEKSSEGLSLALFPTWLIFHN
jgi:hypothetical protein